MTWMKFSVVGKLAWSLAFLGGSACGDAAERSSHVDFMTSVEVSAAQRFALADLNRYRAQHGLAKLAWSPELSRFAGDASADLVATQIAHGYFSAHAAKVSCLRAENQAPGWRGQINDVIESSNKMMMNEGPGGGHYENILHRDYTHVGVGVVTHQGRQYVTTNFGQYCAN